MCKYIYIYIYIYVLLVLLLVLVVVVVSLRPHAREPEAPPQAERQAESYLKP